MIKFLGIKKTTWIAFFVSLIVSFLVTSISYAEGSDEEIASKYGVKFPVQELGNCTNISECRSFCEDPVNQNACIDFAKKKGFYQEPEAAAGKKPEIVEAAKKELGCDSESSCRSFCSEQANFDKCDAFAKSRGLSGGRAEEAAKGKILEKAKEVLGCDSPDSCASFCSQEENKQKCSQFAKETGLRGGEQRVGPGGCTSEETCKAFCSDPQNFQICRGFSESSGRKFSGPGGCNSEESCRDYCKDNEDKCRSFGRQAGESERYNPQEMCSKTPNCKWEENTCKCGNNEGGRTDEGRSTEEYAKLCRENPDRCRPGAKEGFNNEKERQDSGDYCRKNPDKCRPSGNSGGNSFRDGGNRISRDQQEAGCKSGGGTCNWNGDTCNCQGYRAPTSGNYTVPTNNTNTTPSNPTQNTAPSGMNRESQEAGCRSCGGSCNWNGDFCNCQCGSSGSSGGSAPDPAPVQNTAPAPQPAAQEPAPVPPATEPAPAPAVQGITAVRSILDKILDLFR